MIGQQFIILEGVIIFTGWYLVLYYIFKKASKGLAKKDRVIWIKYKLKPLVLVGVFVNLLEIFWLEGLLFAKAE